MWALGPDSWLIAVRSWARLLKGLNYYVLVQHVDHSTHTAVNSSCNGRGGAAVGLSHCDIAIDEELRV